MAVKTDSFFTMDTIAELTVITKKSETGENAVEKIKEICEEVESRISNTIETSEIYKINEFLKTAEHVSDYPISKETAELLKIAKYIQTETNGTFNPSLGDIIDLWGINNHDENFEHKLPEKVDFYPALEKAKILQSYEIKQDGDNYSVSGFESAKIDLGAIGKGYAIDKISDYLVEAGIPNTLVSFGSSILAAGKNKDGSLWNIGLKDPLNPEKICGYLNASDKVISVSGGYERFITISGKDYCHIIDPETGYPVDNDLLCVVVVMESQSALQTKERLEKFVDNGSISDALSTALYVMGKEKALDFYSSSDARLDFEMILFVKDESLPKGYNIIPTNVMFTEIE